MQQHGDFSYGNDDNLVCKLKRLIYSLKKSYRQWYLIFDKVVTYLGFEENIVDQCIYLKVNGSKYVLLVLCVDDILLTSNDLDMLSETKCASAIIFLT